MSEKKQKQKTPDIRHVLFLGLTCFSWGLLKSVVTWGDQLQWREFFLFVSSFYFSTFLKGVLERMKILKWSALCNKVESDDLDNGKPLRIRKGKELDGSEGLCKLSYDLEWEKMCGIIINYWG